MNVNAIDPKKTISIVTITILLISTLAIAIQPASATPAEYLQTQDFESVGEAVWTTDEAHSGDWSVLLSAPLPSPSPGKCGAGRVILPYNKKLDTITDMGFWYNLKEGNPGTNENSAPYMIFELDTVTWVVHEMVEISEFDAWLQWELADDPLPPESMYGKTNMWHVFPGDTPYDEWDDVVAVFGDDTVLNVKVAVGEWLSGVTTRYYVDDIMINGVTYPLEPIVLDSEYYKIGDTAIVTVADIYENDDPMGTETIDIHAESDTDIVGITVTLTETLVNSGIFVGTIPLVLSVPEPGPNELGVSEGDTIYVIYGDPTGTEGVDKFTDIATITPELPVGGTLVHVNRLYLLAMLTGKFLVDRPPILIALGMLVLGIGLVLYRRKQYFIKHKT